MLKSMVPNLMVADVKESVDFYQEKIGFVMVASVPKEDGLQFAILHKDGVNLMLQEKNNFIEEYPVLQREEVQPSISLYIQVDDLQEEYRRFQAVHEIYLELHQTFYGSQEFAILDNSGYVLTFTEADKD